jgi:hypothetical protein
MTLGFQLAEQHLLMAQAVSKQLLIKSTVYWLLSQKQIADLQLIPPSPDEGAAGERREFAWGNGMVHSHLKKNRAVGSDSFHVLVVRGFAVS